MKKILILIPGLMLMFLAGCGGGGGGNSADAVMKETIGVMNEMCVILETSKTVAEAKPKLDTLATRFQELKKKAGAIKTTPAEDEALKKKYEPEIMKMVGRSTAAGMAIGMKDPAGVKDLEKVMGAFK